MHHHFLQLYCVRLASLKLVYTVCVISFFLCAKRPPRKPRRGPQREPTPMCSPCLSRLRSRNSKRWELLNRFLFCWLTIWPRTTRGLWKYCMNMHVCSPCRTLWFKCFLSLQYTAAHANALRSSTYSVFPLFIVVVCPPVYFPASGLAAVKLVVCWYESQRCPDIHPVSSVIRLQGMPWMPG